MEKKISKLSSLALIALLTISAIVFIAPSAKANPTTLEVIAAEGLVPGTHDSNFTTDMKSNGDTFWVNITVVDVTDLQNWQIKLTWDPTLLQYQSIVRPSDHVFSGSGKDMVSPPKDTGPGYVMWGCTYVNGLRGTPDYWTFNGTGTLCQLTLRIRSPPASPATCNLTLVNLYTDTFLLNGDVPAHDITFTVEDGIYTYIDELTVKLGAFGRLLLPSETVQVDYGGTVTFTANITKEGVLPYRYQWFLTYPNGTVTEDTTAENETSWTTPSIIETGSYNVTIKVTDKAGVISTATALVQFKGLQVELSPQQPVVDVNDAVTFKATITGGVPPYTIKWYRNGTEQTAVQGQTEVSFTFTQVGIETVKVNVRDSRGTKREPSTTVRVLFLPPSPPIVKVIPTPATFYTNETKIGDKITLNVTVQGVTDLQAWQIKITWDPTLLNYSDIYLPDDHVFAASGKEMQMVSPETGLGYVLWGVTYVNGDPGTPDYWTFNGTGTLCQIELEIIRQPNVPQSSCILGFAGKYADTFIVNGTRPPGFNTIPFSINNGTYAYVLVQRIRHPVLGGIMETYSNASILEPSVAANTTDKSIQFNVYGATGTGAYVNVTIPKALLWGPWLGIYVNDVDLMSQATITEDATNTYVYIAFEFSSAMTIRIKGSGIVPEQTHLLLITLLIASLIAMILVKASPKKKWIK